MCLFVCLALKVARACQGCQRDSMNGSKRYIDPSYLPINVSTERIPTFPFHNFEMFVPF